MIRKGLEEEEEVNGHLVREEGSRSGNGSNLFLGGRRGGDKRLHETLHRMHRLIFC